MDKSEKLKQIILDRYGSIREFSKVVDIPSTTLTSALDKGIGGMAVDRIIKICEVLNIDIKTFEPISNIKEVTLCENGKMNTKICDQMKQELGIINKIKKEKGFTSKELSQKSRVPIGTLNKILNGQTKNPAYETILSLANALDCPVDMFCKSDEIKFKDNVCGNLSKKEESLLLIYNKLNDLGKKEAVKRVEELTYINKYIDNEICATVDEDDYLMPIAAHADNLTEDEKEDAKKLFDEFYNQYKK